MRRVGWLVLWVAILQGCSFSQPRAPIRDAARHNHPVRHPVRPTTDHVIVQPGENLFRIAFEHGLDYRELAQWNGLNDPSKIYVGQSLRLNSPPERPEPDKAPPADKLATTSAPVPAPKPVPTPVPVAASTVDTTEEAPSSWGWPAQGKVVTEFNENAGAKGIDIAGKRGSPVLATAPGRVIYAGAGLRGYGKLIIIKHSKILLSAYGHNDKVLVTEGQIVKLGQPIAEMGSTDADRVKLHFEIREYGKPVDPMTYLSGSPG